MSIESMTKWAEECERAADLIDDCTGWLEAIEAVWRSRKEQVEVRRMLVWSYHADDGNRHEEPGDETAAYWLREYATDARQHVAALEARAERDAAKAARA